MGATDIKLGSWDEHPAHCKDWNVNVWHMHKRINVMVYFKPFKIPFIVAFYKLFFISLSLSKGLRFWNINEKFL